MSRASRFLFHAWVDPSLVGFVHEDDERVAQVIVEVPHDMRRLGDVLAMDSSVHLGELWGVEDLLDPEGSR